MHMEGYLFDPHTHTAETSKCGHLPAAEVVDRYVRNGFSGLVVTDHLHPEYLSRIDTDHDWNKVMDHYLAGYHASKKRGDEVGFQVLLGAELRFPENDNDYLVYGIDEDWLRSNPYVCCTSAREFFRKFHDQVLIIHAHPYRDGNTADFFRLAGSDTHQAGDEARAGVLLPEKPADSFAYKALIEQRRFRLWSPEFQSFVDADEEMRKEEAK